MMSQKLFVLSIDSLFDEDMPFFSTLPNFGKFLKKASFVKGGMRSVYPTLTYPAHASIITGVYPESHGIFHNEILDAGNPIPDWYWYRRDLRAETIIDVAKKAGYSTCCVGWPVMGGCPNTDYLVPEIWPKTETEDPRSLLLNWGSANVQDIIERHYHKMRTIHQPFLDFMMTGCAVDIIRKFRPDVTFMHLAHLDHARHENGLFGPMVEQALVLSDDFLGRLMEAAADAGIREETNFVVSSDHGHLPVKWLFNPNVLLAQKGLITVDSSGAVRDWKAWCNSAALSCHVVMKDPSDGETRRLLEDLLYEMRATREYGVESVFTKEEAQNEWHLAGNFEYVLEGGRAFSFGNDCTGPVLAKPDKSDYKFSVASHGHLPHKGAQPVFMMTGPVVKENAVIPRQRIIDEAPTFARILGFTLPQAQGRALEELLKY
jgi:predicted AlkP superfamily pyrophosphatase or phosphodiesterase